MYNTLQGVLSHLDYVAVIPDRAWVDRGVGVSQRFRVLPLSTAVLNEISQRLPVVLHGIGLSICSAEIFDQEYAQNLILGSVNTCRLHELELDTN